MDQNEKSARKGAKKLGLTKNEMAKIEESKDPKVARVEKQMLSSLTPLRRERKLLDAVPTDLAKFISKSSPKRVKPKALGEEKPHVDLRATEEDENTTQHIKRKRLEVSGAKEPTSEPRPSTSAGPPQQLPQKVTPKQSPKEAAAGQLIKRMILIDASNVAFGYTDEFGSRKTDADYSAEGLKIAVDYFEDLGFQVKAILPEFRIRRDKSSNHEIMMQLKDTGKLMCTPSKSYDDRVILEAAVRFDAAVVSNHHYRDLLNEKPELREVTLRIIRFNWLLKQLIVPEDPHGRNGPQLKDILYKTAT